MLDPSRRSHAFRPARALALAAALAAFVPGAALACGGGVTSEDAELTVSQQVALYSFRADGTTDVVVELAIPSATGDFGVILPVTGVPVLDDTPVEAQELLQLDELTAPQIIQDDESGDDGSSGSSSGSGCGCGNDDDLEGGGDDGGSGDDGGGSKVDVLDVADIGPVTAVSFAADDADALDAWLTENGFVIPDAQRELIDSYAVPGGTFIAFRRSDAAPQGASAVGVHFTLPSAYAAYPMRLATLGAAQEIGIRVYLAGATPLGPAEPFATLALNQLDEDLVLEQGYTAGLAQAVRDHGNRAFVVEGVFEEESQWRSGLGERLTSMTDDDATLTRLTTVVNRLDLTADVTFDRRITNHYDNQIDVSTTASLGAPAPTKVRWGSVGLFFGTVATSVARRRRRRV
jgi:hypothetical protein